MLNERYGNLLDNVMNKKDTTMIDTAERLTDKMIARKQAEINRINSSIRDRELSKQLERETIEKSNEVLNKWINVVKAKHDAESKRADVKRKEMCDAEMRRKTTENLNWKPSPIKR